MEEVRVGDGDGGGDGGCGDGGGDDDGGGEGGGWPPGACGGLWPPGATAVGGARLRWVAPRWRLAGVPQAAPAAGDLRWCLRRAVSGGGSCGERPLAGRSLRQASLRTVRRQVAPSAGGSGGAGGIAYLPRRLRQEGVERRGLALGAEVGRRLFWRLRA